MSVYRAAILVFMHCALPATAQDAALPDIRGDLLANMTAGVICAPKTDGTRPAPDTVAGETHLIAETPPFVAITRRVPAVVGIGFGVTAQTVDAAGIEDVTMAITHPAMGSSRATVQRFDTRISGLSPSMTFYQFEFDYELLPGIWQMQASVLDTVIYRTTFEVVPPALMPELAQVCGFEELLS